MRELYIELEKSKIKNEVLTNVVKRVEQELSDMKNRVEMLEEYSSRKTILLSNFQCKSYRKKHYIGELEAFFSKVLKVDVNIEDAYPIGEGTPRQMVIILESFIDKMEILQKKAKLKGYTNAEGNEYYITEQNPAIKRETNRRNKELVNENDAKEEREKAEMKIRRGKLLIDNEPYKKKITTPTAGTLLELSVEEIERILAIQLKKGATISQGGSTFISYAVDADNHQTVQEAYIKVKLLHADARHATCIFNLPGLETHYNKDYCEDGEIGVGSKLLNFMLNNDIVYKAIYVVRYYGGQRLGPERYECYVEAAKSVIINNPHNAIISKNQQVKPNLNTIQHTTRYLPRRGRGGVRGGMNIRTRGSMNRRQTMRTPYKTEYRDPRGPTRRRLYQEQRTMNNVEESSEWQEQDTFTFAQPHSVDIWGTTHEQSELQRQEWPTPKEGLSRRNSHQS